LLPFELGSIFLHVWTSYVHVNVWCILIMKGSNYEGCYLCETLFSGPSWGISIQPLLSLSYQLDQT
jgi:hypothetical protein